MRRLALGCVPFFLHTFFMDDKHELRRQSAVDIVVFDDDETTHACTLTHTDTVYGLLTELNLNIRIAHCTQERKKNHSIFCHRMCINIKEPVKLCDATTMESACSGICTNNNKCKYGRKVTKEASISID